MARKSKRQKQKQEQLAAEGKLTPYQGELRTFGFFKCPDCGRSWGSAYSWANVGQSCRNCKINVYPHTQVRPKKAEDTYVSDPLKNHERRLCQKCIKEGRFCGENSKSLPISGKRRRGRRNHAAAA